LDRIAQAAALVHPASRDAFICAAVEKLQRLDDPGSEDVRRIVGGLLRRSHEAA
jgi:hypothetical protein